MLSPFALVSLVSDIFLNNFSMGSVAIDQDESYLGTVRVGVASARVHMRLNNFKYYSSFSL